MTHPKERFYLRQLERMLDESLTPLRRELDKLEKNGLLFSQVEGNSKYYSVNEGFPIYSELKSIVFKTQGIANSLRQNLKKVGTIKFAFIYGSTAENTERMNSDIDLMVIGDVDIKELNSVVSKAESALIREVSYRVFTEEEIAKRRKEKDDFIMEVLKGKKIMLIGEEDELLKVVG
jgi:predicted nucleotidyltransferase